MRTSLVLCPISFVIAGALLNSAAAAAYPGDVSCRCIDVFALPVTVDGVAVDSSSDCPWKSEDGTCYAANYGSTSCMQHDVATAGCADYDENDESKAWCVTPWCYVDPEACERPMSESVFFGEKVLRDGKPLSYSYATCGHLDYYSRGDNELRNLGRMLRVSWAPIDSSTGYTKVEVGDGETGVVDSTGYDTRQSGAIVEFMADLFAYHDIKWKFVPVSNESMTYTPSQVTNCIHEVAVNRTDICFFDSWLLDFRLELSTMTALFEDTFKVMVRVEAAQTLTFSEMLKLPFSPFTPALWLIVVGQYIVCTLFIFWLEGSYNDEDFPEPSIKGGIIQSIYKGAMAAFGGGLLMNPQTVPAKLVSVGMTLSILVFASIYGAQVTTALVESRLGAATGAISSFEEGLERGTKFCVYAFTEPFLKARWPTINSVAVGQGGKVYELFDGLHDGRCEASLIMDNWWLAAKAGVYSGPESPLFDTVYNKDAVDEEDESWKNYHCRDKIYPLPSLQTAWSIANGFPVREELSRAIRWAVKRAEDDPERRYSIYSEKYKEKYVQPADGCTEAGPSSEDEEIAATVQDGVGPTMVSVFSIAVALLVSGAIKLVDRKHNASGPDEDACASATGELAINHVKDVQILTPAAPSESPVRATSGASVAKKAIRTISAERDDKTAARIREALAEDEHHRRAVYDEFSRRFDQIQARLDSLSAGVPGAPPAVSGANGPKVEVESQFEPVTWLTNSFSNSFNLRK